MKVMIIEYLDIYPKLCETSKFKALEMDETHAPGPISTQIIHL